MDITKTYVIGAPVTEVWRALTDPETIDAWGGGPAEILAEPGEPFRQWGGDIHGTVIEVSPPSRLVEEWFGGDWPRPSVATFELMPAGAGTRVTLTHTGVPDDEAGDIDAGWDDFYFGPMKDLLENR